MSTFSLRRSAAIDPAQLGDKLEQHNSWCQAVEEVMMWWRHENFTKSHMEGERRNFPWDRNWEKKLKWHCVHRHFCSSGGSGDKSRFICDDVGLGCKMHNVKFPILNHWQTLWKVWASLGVKTSVWLSQPHPYHGVQLCHQKNPVSLQGLQEHLLVLL